MSTFIFRGLFVKVALVTAPLSRGASTGGNAEFPLPSVAAGQLSIYGGAKARVVEAPTGTDEIIGRGVAADAFDDDSRRQQFEEVDQDTNVLFAVHQLNFAAGDLVGQWRVADRVEIVELDGIDPETRDFASGGE